jgi:hypothetical protein
MLRRWEMVRKTPEKVADLLATSKQAQLTLPQR